VDVVFVAIARVEPDLFEAWGREPLTIHHEGFAVRRIDQGKGTIPVRGDIPGHS